MMVVQVWSDGQTRRLPCTPVPKLGCHPLVLIKIYVVSVSSGLYATGKLSGTCTHRDLNLNYPPLHPDLGTS